LTYHPEGGEETKPVEEAVRRRRGFNNKMVEEQQREKEIQRSPMRMKVHAAPVAASSTTTETPEEKIYEVINGRVFNKNKQEMMTGEDWLMKMHLAGKALINRGAIEKAFLDREDLEAIITGYGTVAHLSAECGKLKCSTSRKSYRICEECRSKKWENVVKVEYRGLGPATNPVSGAPGR